MPSTDPIQLTQQVLRNTKPARDCFIFQQVAKRFTFLRRKPRKRIPFPFLVSRTISRMIAFS